MDIKNIILSYKPCHEKYEYYKKLGYSEEASCVLSLLTYGSISEFVADFGSEDVLKKIYGYFLEKNVSNISDVYNLVDEKRNDMFLRMAVSQTSGGSAKKGGFFSSIKNSGRATSALDGIYRTKASKGSKVESSAMVTSDSAMMRTAAPMMSATTAMNAVVVEMEEIATDSYEQIEEKSAKNVFTSPTSTFRMTTNTASVGVILNQIRRNRNVDISQVRIEEVLNYFNYKSKYPVDKKFEINTELMNKGKDKKLLYINVQGTEEEKEHKNIILLLDVSGSMSSNNEVTQETIATVVSKLKEGDIFSLITYSSTDATVFDSFKISSDDDKEYIMGKVLGLEINGCTYGSAGIETAYKIGAKNYNKDWNNQVVLITDGDLNFGITSKDGLKGLIEEKKKDNLFLSVVGTGLWNYKDDKLEVLSKHGNGTYCVVNNLFDVDESINKNYTSLTNVIAKDVKAQVEFNPKYVKEYRLLGYENRALNHEDFVDDTVISEPYGSGGHGVAVYELICGDGENKQNLKYQTPQIVDSNELCTIKVRYKEPLSDKSTEIEKIVYADETDCFNCRLAYFLYCLSEKLRKSDKLDKDDEDFLAKFIKESEYDKYSELNGDKLRVFVEYYMKK